MNSPEPTSGPAHGDIPMPVRSLGAHVCPKLRTKTMYLNIEHRRAADEPESFGTAVFRCLKTMSPLGPDEAPASPEDCVRGRGCCDLPPLA